MPAPAPTPAAFIETEEVVRKLRAGGSILSGTIRNHLSPGKQRQAALMHVAAALQLAIDAVRAMEVTDGR